MNIKQLDWITLDYTWARCLGMEFSIFLEEGKYVTCMNGSAVKDYTQKFGHSIYNFPAANTLDEAKQYAQDAFEKIIGSVLM